MNGSQLKPYITTYTQNFKLRTVIRNWFYMLKCQLDVSRRVIVKRPGDSRTYKSEGLTGPRRDRLDLPFSSEEKGSSVPDLNQNDRI